MYHTAATKIYHVLDHSGNVSKFHKGDVIQASFIYASTITRNSTTQKKCNIHGNKTQIHTIADNY